MTKISKYDISKYPFVDALRGIAVLLVMMHHATMIYGRNIYSDLLISFKSEGSRGVELFFIVSAFTLFRSLTLRSKDEKHFIRNFFIRRFFRISPLYYLVILFYLVAFFSGIIIWFTPVSTINFSHLLTLFTYTNGFNKYYNTFIPGAWTINVEMTFYVLLPLLFIFITSLKRSILVFFISCILFLIPVNNYFLPHLPIFLLGIVGYFLLEFWKGKNEIKIIQKLDLSFILVGSLYSIFLLRLTSPSPLLAGVLFLILFCRICLAPTRILVNPFLEYIGKISFSLYLTHFIVLYYMSRFHFINFATKPFMNFSIRFIVLLGISIVVSTITFLFIEVPGQKVGKKIILLLKKKENRF